MSRLVLALLIPSVAAASPLLPSVRFEQQLAQDQPAQASSAPSSAGPAIGAVLGVVGIALFITSVMVIDGGIKVDPQTRTPLGIGGLFLSVSLGGIGLLVAVLSSPPAAAVAGK
jgi:hypothetical protein